MSDNDGYDSPDQLSSGCPSPMNDAGNESDSEQSNHNNNSPMKSPASSHASRVSEPSEDSDCSPAQTNFNRKHSDDERSIHGDEHNDDNGLDYDNDSPRAVSEDENNQTRDVDNVSVNDGNISEEERVKNSDDEEEDNIASPSADVNDEDEDLNNTNNAEDDVDNISDSEAENGNEYKKNSSDGSDDEPNESKTPRENREKIESDDDDLVKKSGSEDEGNVEELFGNASDISSSNEDDDGQANDARNESACELSDQNQSSQRWKDGSMNEDDEDDELGRKHEVEEEEEEEIQEIRIDAVFPKINTNLGDSLHFVKLPNFLSIDPKTFDEQQYEDEVDEEELMDEEGRTRLKLKVENTLRWRYAKDANGNLRYDEHGNLVKESNARMVRWSDGSLSLHLGNEVFDVHPMEMKSDHTHLFVRQGLGLQGQAVFTSKLSFRPHSTDSFTHRKMTLSLADRSSKAQKVKVLPIVGKNPESQRSELIKKEDDKLKAVMRRENKQRRIKEKAFKRGISSHYLETGYDEEEDENTVSVSAIKKRHKGHKPIYTSDDDSEDDGRRRSAKRPAESDSEEEETRNPKKKNVVCDSDED